MHAHVDTKGLVIALQDISFDEQDTIIIGIPIFLYEVFFF